MDVTECSADHACPDCGKMYIEEADLYAHWKRFHEKDIAKRRKIDSDWAVI